MLQESVLRDNFIMTLIHFFFFSVFGTGGQLPSPPAPTLKLTHCIRNKESQNISNVCSASSDLAPLYQLSTGILVCQYIQYTSILHKKGACS